MHLFFAFLVNTLTTKQRVVRQLTTFVTMLRDSTLQSKTVQSTFFCNKPLPRILTQVLKMWCIFATKSSLTFEQFLQNWQYCDFVHICEACSEQWVFLIWVNILSKCSTCQKNVKKSYHYVFCHDHEDIMSWAFDLRTLCSTIFFPANKNVLLYYHLAFDIHDFSMYLSTICYI